MDTFTEDDTPGCRTVVLLYSKEYTYHCLSKSKKIVMSTSGTRKETESLLEKVKHI